MDRDQFLAATLKNPVNETIARELLALANRVGSCPGRGAACNDAAQIRDLRQAR